MSGEPLLEVETIRSQSSLLGLVLGRFRDISLTIERPHLQLVMRPDGSNVEDVLQGLFSQSSSQAELGGSVVIEGGTVTCVDSVSGAHWSATDVNANLAATGNGGFDAQLESALSVESDEPGTLSARLSSGDTASQLRVAANKAPLQMLESFLRRVDPACQLTGKVTGEVRYDARPSGETATVEQMIVSDLSIVASGWLQDEQLTVPAIMIDGTASRRGTEWELSTLRVQSEMLNLQAQGSGQAGHVGQTGVWELLSKCSFQTAGKVELARLAEVIPKTMRLREGARIVSGQLAFTLDAEQQEAGQLWKGELETGNLAVLAGADPIQWDDPLHLTVVARQQDRVWTVDQLTCRTNSLNLSGKGSATQGAASIRGDLGEFATELGRFIDLGGTVVTGQLDGSARWQREGSSVVIDGSAQARDFAWVSPDRDPWREDALRVTVEGEGRADGRQLTELVAGSVKLVSGSDDCNLELAAPISIRDISSGWPLRVSLQGQLETWLPRLRLLLPLESDGWSGQIQLDTELVVSQEQIQVEGMHAIVNDLAGSAAGLDFREPRLELQLSGGWDQAAQRGAASYVSMAGSAIAFRAEDVRVQSEPVMWSGRVGYRADLDRLSSWFPTRQRHLRGQLIGHAQLSADGGSTNVEWSVDGEGLDYLITEPTNARGAPGDRRAVAWKSVWAEGPSSAHRSRPLGAGSRSSAVRENRAALRRVQLGRHRCRRRTE